MAQIFIAQQNNIPLHCAWRLLILKLKGIVRMNELLPEEQKPGRKGCRSLHFQENKGRVA